MDDITEIKTDVKTLLQQSAVHNQILSEHKNFSIALQSEQKIIRTELEPIKTHVHLVNNLGKVLIAIVVGVSIQTLIRHFFST